MTDGWVQHLAPPFIRLVSPARTTFDSLHILPLRIAVVACGCMVIVEILLNVTKYLGHSE